MTLGLVTASVIESIVFVRWLVGVAVSTRDSESLDRGSNPLRACQPSGDQQYAKCYFCHFYVASRFLPPPFY